VNFRVLQLAGVNVLLTVVLLLTAVSPWTAVYAVDTGSMQPTIDGPTIVICDDVGSISDVELRDIVYARLPNGERVVHQVIRIDPVDKTVTTRGINNSQSDPRINISAVSCKSRLLLT